MPAARARLLFITAVAASTTSLVTVEAGATSSDQVATKQETHCVVVIVDQAEDGELRTSEPDCYATEDEAAARASRPLTLEPRFADGPAAAVSAGSTYTIGIHYDGYNGTGSSITVVGSSCVGGYWNTPSWFDNRISSSYNGCYRLRHYDRPNRSGTWADTTGVGQTDNLPGSMNNRTESVAYFGS